MELREADATSLPVEDEDFDAALCVQVLEYVENADAALAEMRRALKPGGRLGGLGRRLVDRLLALAATGAWSACSPPGTSTWCTLRRRARLRAAAVVGFERVAMEAHAFATDELDPETGGSLPLVIEPFVSGRAGVSGRSGRVGGRTPRPRRARRVLLRVRAVLLPCHPVGSPLRGPPARLLAVVRISVGVGEADVHPGDLSGYAASRGLDFRSQALQLGYLGAFPWAEELMFNARDAGVLPGGERGVLLHEIKLFDEGTRGNWPGPMTVRTAGFKWWHLIPLLDLFGDTWSYFRWPHTVAAVRIPEATDSPRPVRGGAGRSFRDGKRTPQRHELVAADWVPVSRQRADPAAVEQVLLGPVQDALMPPRELGFTIEFMYRQLLVYQQGFLTDPGQLDAFCHTSRARARDQGGLRPGADPRSRSRPSCRRRSGCPRSSR